MSESTKKRNNYNESILAILKDRYGFSYDYMRKCLRGDRTGTMSDLITREYTKLDNASNKAIKDAANQLEK